VQKCSPDVPVPNCAVPTTALIGEHPGCPLSKYVDAGGPAISDCVCAGACVVINPVSHEPEGLVDALPDPFLAVTTTVNAFPTSEDPTVYVLDVAPAPDASEHDPVTGNVIQYPVPLLELICTPVEDPALVEQSSH
jgi:hypothetical protein